jgi:hypothetical protein
LETSNPLLPPDADATSALEVIPVHDNVHGQVKDNGDPRDRGRTNELRVAEKSGSTMVIAVEEGCHGLAETSSSTVGDFRVCHTEGLLLEEQEDSVEELQILGEIVELAKGQYSSYLDN